MDIVCLRCETGNCVKTDPGCASIEFYRVCKIKGLIENLNAIVVCKESCVYRVVPDNQLMDIAVLAVWKDEFRSVV